MTKREPVRSQWTRHIDVAVEGSVIGFKPLTPEGREWWNENVGEHEGWQQFAGRVWADHRNGWRIIDAIAHHLKG